HCPSCDRFLPDRYMEGTCPHCGTDARGDECDQGCGVYLEPGEILNPRCTICGTTAEYKETSHQFLKLTAFESFLKEFLERLGGTENARNYAKGWLKGGLKDWNITRNLDWGIPFPGSKDLTFYVWFDAPIGYIGSTEEWAERTGGDWEHYWKGPGRLIHFIGGDIVYHHCLFWPSMLKGAGYSVPDAVVASGMVKVEGHNFSKAGAMYSGSRTSTLRRVWTLTRSVITLLATRVTQETLTLAGKPTRPSSTRNSWAFWGTSYTGASSSRTGTMVRYPRVSSSPR
ncbi:class I tRNA ligase family protein, partial [Candidatus Bathyarchaeota archaeon]|nr:class I tRNA ligase family protein [Candidatus Bathyarchaeota archaeon]